MWKPEYAAKRKAKYHSDETERERRLAQSAPDPAARKSYMKDYVIANPEKFKRTPEQQAKINSLRRAKYAENQEFRDAAKAKSKEWQEANPHKRHAQRLNQYGLTPDTFLAMMESQNHKCAICGHSDKSQKKTFPMIDHCHETGKVRGILCSSCNMGIGKFKDNIELLEAAIKYLKTSRS